jgi:hypothetical protein
MAPILRSFSKPIVQAFKDAGIEDQLKDFDPPLFAEPYTPPPTRRGRHGKQHFFFLSFPLMKV